MERETGLGHFSLHHIQWAMAAIAKRGSPGLDKLGVPLGGSGRMTLVRTVVPVHPAIRSGPMGFLGPISLSKRRWPIILKVGFCSQGLNDLATFEVLDGSFNPCSSFLFEAPFYVAVVVAFPPRLGAGGFTPPWPRGFWRTPRPAAAPPGRCATTRPPTAASSPPPQSSCASGSWRRSFRTAPS